MSEQIERTQFDVIDGSTLEGGSTLVVVGQEADGLPVYYEVGVVSGASEDGPPVVTLNRAGQALKPGREMAQRLLGQNWLTFMGTCDAYSVSLTGNDRPADGLGTAIAPGVRLCFGALTGPERFVTEPLVDGALFERSFGQGS